jgi:hypothetical protein
MTCFQFHVLIVLGSICVGNSVPAQPVDRNMLLDLKNNIIKLEMERTLNYSHWTFENHFHEKLFRNRANFLSGEYSNITGDLPVYVIFSAFSQINMGNDIGRVINDMGCAYRAGLHAIVINRKYDVRFDDESAETGQRFLDQLTTVYTHPTPNTLAVGTDIVRAQCACVKYCWSDATAPWIDMALSLREIFNRALPLSAQTSFSSSIGSSNITHAHSKSESNEHVPLLDSSIITHFYAPTITTHPLTGETTAVTGTDIILPSVPEVVIQLRCSDNLAKMGLLPFQAIFDRLDSVLLKRRHVTDTDRSRGVESGVSLNFIYITTEHHKRLHYQQFGHICNHVLTSLQHQLSRRYVGTVVSIQRGLMFHTWSQYLHAKVIICGRHSPTATALSIYLALK